MHENTDKQRRIKRFALQSAAREILPDFRVAICLRKVVPKTPGVKVWKAPEVGRAFYSNLVICARVWVCPVCASKITERRRQELGQAIRQPGYQVALIGFTLRHNGGDHCDSLLEDILASYRRLKSGKRWINFERATGLVGSIRALEVTHGANGWHPHLHVLFFVAKGKAVDWQKVGRFLKARWRAVLAQNERTATFEHGVFVQEANKAVGGYVAKWGLDSEMTKAPVKQARTAEGRTPMQLLSDFLNGDAKAGDLFREYALAFKGKRQLVWSRGLRKLLNIGEEKTDEALATEEREDAILLATLTRAQWVIVLANDARAEVLEVANTGDADALRVFLASIGADDDSTRRIDERIIRMRAAQVGVNQLVDMRSGVQLPTLKGLQSGKKKRGRQAPKNESAAATGRPPRPHVSKTGAKTPHDRKSRKTP